MAILTLKINDKVLDKVVWFLQQFKKSDVEIIDEEFIKIQKELQKDYEDAMDPNSKSYTIEEFDQILKDTIAKYETNSKK